METDKEIIVDELMHLRWIDLTNELLSNAFGEKIHLLESGLWQLNFKTFCVRHRITGEIQDCYFDDESKNLCVDLFLVDNKKKVIRTRNLLEYLSRQKIKTWGVDDIDPTKDIEIWTDFTPEIMSNASGLPVKTFQNADDCWQVSNLARMRHRISGIFNQPYPVPQPGSVQCS